jgi:osomolarity two-component system, phosphorelay intermediate protein YPD1
VDAGIVRGHMTHQLTGCSIASRRAGQELDELSSLGHFLKGSSATLGFTKIKDSCQLIQQYGHKMKIDGTPEPDEAVCLARITEAIKTAKADMVELEKLMEKFFNGSDST